MGLEREREKTIMGQEKEKKEKTIRTLLALALILTITIITFSSIASADPTGPSSINVTSNETKATTSGQEINISGGVISKINITASVQNVRWKAFLGWISGSFTLEDASGSRIYAWSTTTVGGQVYATRNSSTPDWSSISCADASQVTAEDTALEQIGEDNISSTFTDNSNSETFSVAGTPITAGTCFATNTYVNSTSQSSTFEEVILYDNTNTIFTTILEQNSTGYDGNGYDFQMLVPENGNATWSSSTAYYLYVELTTA